MNITGTARYNFIQRFNRILRFQFLVSFPLFPEFLFSFEPDQQYTTVYVYTNMLLYLIIIRTHGNSFLAALRKIYIKRIGDFQCMKVFGLTYFSIRVIDLLGK